MEDRDYSFIATGNVDACRFVKIDTAGDGKCAQASTNERPIGISEDGSRQAPGTAADDGHLAIATENVAIYGPGRKCLLDIAGTVTAGTYLKSDSSGKGVAALTTGTVVQEHGAVALQAGVSGQRILVEVRCFPFLPAVS